MADQNESDKMLRLIPTFGILLFVGLYIFSASLYPGGSEADLHSEGFDWAHNYWCNLLNVKAMNGETNPARPYAIAAMAVLCTVMAYFFYQFPRYFTGTRLWNTTIRVSGISAMLCALLVFTDFHDELITLSSLFGFLALVGVFVSLWKNRQKGLYGQDYSVLL